MDDCKFRMVEMMHLYLSGAITDEEMQELQKWLDAAPENRAMFDRVCKGKDILYKYRMYKKIDHRAAYERCEKRVVEICGDVITSFGDNFRTAKK